MGPGDLTIRCIAVRLATKGYSGRQIARRLGLRRCQVWGMLGVKA